MVINIRLRAGSTLVRGYISEASGNPFPVEALLGGSPATSPPLLTGGGAGINPSRR